MEKQRATEIMMEALCLSVPYDPAFVLEVHKDVLKSRLRCAPLSSSFPLNLMQQAQYGIRAHLPLVKPIFVDAFASRSCAHPLTFASIVIFGRKVRQVCAWYSSFKLPRHEPDLAVADSSLFRKSFSVQVRDYLDLCVTRLADLKGQEETGRCKENGTRHDRTPGAGESISRETGHVDGDCGDPTTREVKN